MLGNGGENLKSFRFKLKILVGSGVLYCESVEGLESKSLYRCQNKTTIGFPFWFG